MSPVSPVSPLRWMQRQLQLFGGMLTRPVATLQTIARDGAPAWLPVALYLVVTMLVQLKVLLRLWFLLDEGGETIFRRIREAILDDADTDALLLAISIAVLVAAAHFLRTSGERVRHVRAAAAACWLLVPLIVLKCIGGALQAAGFDQWWLPHEAVDSMAIVVGKQVSWLRFTVKCLVAYGPSLVMGALLIRAWARPSSPPSSAPAADALTWVGSGAATVSLVALVVAATISAVQASDRIRPLQAGDALPDVALRKLDESGVAKGKVKLSSFQGKVLVLDFWASWCTPCKRSMPELSKLSDELGPRGLVVLGVNREPSEPKEAAAALAQIKPTFASVIDDRFYGDKIGLTTLPTSYIVDKKGIVRHLHLGYTEIDIVRTEVEALLAE